MFYKKFINHRKKLLHLLKLKSISEKRLFKLQMKNMFIDVYIHVYTYMFIDLKSNSRFNV